MNVTKSQVGLVLGIICLVTLASSFLLPWWTIQREERSPTVNPLTYINSTYGFGLLGVSTHNRDEVLGSVNESAWVTSYADVQDSSLALHFNLITALVILGATFTVLYMVLNRLSVKKESLKLIGLILAFGAIFAVLGSAAYLNIFVPQAVGDSDTELADELHTILPEIGTFSGSDIVQNPGLTTTWDWGPSYGWYLAFVFCVIMIFTIWLVESGSEETEEEVEEETD